MMVVQRLVFAVLFAAIFVFRESSSKRCSSEGDGQNAIFCWGDTECCEHNTKCCITKKKSDDSVSSSRGSNRHVFIGGGLHYGGSSYGSAGYNSRLNVPNYQNRFNVPNYDFGFPKTPPKVPEFKIDLPKPRSTRDAKIVSGLHYGGSSYGSAGYNSRLNVPSYRNKFNVPNYNFDFPKSPPKVPEFKLDLSKPRSTGDAKMVSDFGVSKYGSEGYYSRLNVPSYEDTGDEITKLGAVFGTVGVVLTAWMILSYKKHFNKKRSTWDDDLPKEVRVVESNTNLIENEGPRTNRMNHIIETRTDPRFTAIPLPPPPPRYDVVIRLPAPNAPPDLESDRPPPYEAVAAHGNHEENKLLTRV